MTDHRTHIRHALRAHREALGLSQTAAAEQLRINRSEYAHLENGTRGATIDRLLRIAAELGLDIDIVCGTMPHTA